MTIMTAPKQHKQRYYYIFWGLATLCVVIGQINIISTYNRLSNNLEFLLIEQIRQKTTETCSKGTEMHNSQESAAIN